MTKNYAVIFERAENNWVAYDPDLPGCITHAKRWRETERSIRKAIQGRIPTLRELGEPVPPPASLEREMEIPPAA